MEKSFSPESKNDYQNDRGGGGSDHHREQRQREVVTKVYVGRLGPEATSQEIENAFSKFGPVKSVWVVARNPAGFAFVEFEDRRDAEDAIRGLDGTHCCGTRISVEMSLAKNRSGNRRGGGGDSGRSSYRSRSPRHNY